MICDECGKNEATFHSISKINGMTKEKHLCADCQKKYGYKMMKLSGIGDLFSNFTNLLTGGPSLDEIVCPECGTTSEDFLNTGYVGCSNCYKEFSGLILPVVQRVQSDVRHVGKTPIGFEGNESAEYERLKAELDKAIELENFEQASILRDRMRQLKGGN